MKLVHAELTELEGEDAVMRSIREFSIYELFTRFEPAIPITHIEGFSVEQDVPGALWVPISGEDPIHISIDFRDDQHNLLPKEYKPAPKPVYEARTKEDERWNKGYRTVHSATYQLAGMIAASDLCVDPNAKPRRFNLKNYERKNKLFDEFTGEWGAFLLATVEYVKIQGAKKEKILSARLAILESEDEFKEKRGMNPAEHFKV